MTTCARSNRCVAPLRNSARAPGSPASTREHVDVLQLRHGRWKVHPLIDWNDRDIWQYLSRHDLPYHPLWHEGYVSIGDVHTTRPWQPGMREEDTRYFGLKRECGIHLEV